METGAVRWARQRTREHLRARPIIGGLLLPAAAAVIGALVTVPAHPTVGDRLLQGLIAAAAAYISVGAGTFVYAFVRAPYEQQNALRHQLSDKTAHPQLEIEARITSGFVVFSVTNHGPTDTFQVFQGDPKQGRPLSWEPIRVGLGQRAERTTEQTLRKGATAAIVSGWPHDAPGESEMLLTVLSDTHDRDEFRFLARETLLGVREIKALQEEWPPRDQDWLSRVRRLSDELLSLRTELAGRPHDDLPACELIQKVVRDAFDKAPVVVGMAFKREFDEPIAVPQELADTPNQHVPITLLQLERSINALQNVLTRGTDVV